MRTPGFVPATSSGLVRRSGASGIQTLDFGSGPGTGSWDTGTGPDHQSLGIFFVCPPLILITILGRWQPHRIEHSAYVTVLCRGPGGGIDPCMMGALSSSWRPEYPCDTAGSSSRRHPALRIGTWNVGSQTAQSSCVYHYASEEEAAFIFELQRGIGQLTVHCDVICIQAVSAQLAIQIVCWLPSGSMPSYGGPRYDCSRCCSAVRVFVANITKLLLVCWQESSQRLGFT